MATVTTAGTYVLVVETNAMVNGDTLELRLYLKTLSGSTSRVAYEAIYVNVQGVPVKVSIPVPTTHEIKATLKQTAGTGRAFPWELVSL